MTPTRSPRRGKAVALGGLTAALVASGAVVLAPAAHADVTHPANLTAVATTPTSGLVPGQPVTVQVTANSTGRIFAIDARICKPGLDYAFSADFGPTQTGQCALNPLSPGADGVVSVAPPPESSNPTPPNQKDATITFKVGQGTDTYTYPGGTAVSSTAAAPAWLVLRFNSDEGTTFQEFPLSYASNPTASTITNVAAGDSSAAVTFNKLTAAGDLGNGAIDQYTVTATPVSGDTVTHPVRTSTVSGAALSVAGATLTSTVTGLDNFTPYHFTVTTRTVASDGTTTLPAASDAAGIAAATSAPVDATPGPTGPSGVTGTPADSKVSLTWAPPANTTGLTGYVITATRTGGNPDPGDPHAPVDTSPSTATSYTFNGLVNGAIYTFRVQAVYGAGNLSAPSAPSGAITPQGKFITQTIDVTRPTGDLVLTQVAGGSLDPSVGTYPTNSFVHLGTAQLATTGPQAGQVYTATGAINQVTVLDTRDSDPGWNVNGQVTDFATADVVPLTFSGDNLGWSPVVTDHSAPFTFPGGTYAQQVVAGPTLTPSAAGTGLASTGSELAHGGLGATGTGGLGGPGLGLAHLDAGLSLNIPITAKAGTYTATLTITAI